MKQWKRYQAVLIYVISLLCISVAAPASAGSNSVSGAFVGSGATMPVVAIASPNCTAQGATPVRYKIHRFYVDQDGVYTFSVSSTVPVGGLISLYLHSSGFNPANSLPTCLAADNSTPIGFTYALSANTTYVAVPFDDTFTQVGGSYTLTISGPGNVVFTESDGGSDVWPGFLDGRLNNYDPWATFVVYCQNTSVELYSLNGEARGTLAYSATKEEIDAIDATAGNVLIKEGAGVRLYKLSTGELQFVGAPDAEGKVYNVIISAFPCEFRRSFFT